MGQHVRRHKGVYRLVVFSNGIRPLLSYKFSIALRAWKSAAPVVRRSAVVVAKIRLLLYARYRHRLGCPSAQSDTDTVRRTLCDDVAGPAVGVAEVTVTGGNHAAYPLAVMRVV